MIKTTNCCHVSPTLTLNPFVARGVDRIQIRAGVIGEIGTSWPISDNEKKVLKAAVMAQQRTGAPLIIHPGRDENAPMEIINILRYF